MRPPQADNAEAAEPIRRRSEIEDPTNLWIVHPISNRLTPLFARVGITPNAVSIAGMAFGLLAGVAYGASTDRRWAVLGFLLMLAWHVMDGVDGQLARLTGTHSPFGKILDGICDYVTFGAVYVGLAVAMTQRSGPWVWAVVVLAGACHAIQAAIYEVQRQEYNFWGRGQKSAALPEPGARLSGRPMADALHRTYLTIQRLAVGLDGPARRHLATALRSGREAGIRLLYRDTFAALVRRWSVLSANYRTLAILLFVLARHPLGYFCYEIVVLGAITAILLRSRNIQLRRFLQRIDAKPATPALSPERHAQGGIRP